MMPKHGVMSLTTSRVHAGTRLTVSLHWRSTVEGETVVTKICMASSVAMMHVTESKIGARNVNTLNKSDMKKGTMITMVPIMTNLTDSILPRGAQCRRSQGIFLQLEEGALAPELQAIGNREV
jgi:hypothetical protein